jgi:HSP20 family protein
MSRPTPNRPRLERLRSGWPMSWDPLSEFGQLWDRMGQLFETTAQDAWIPMVETEETQDAYVIRAEMPGMRRQDINVEVDGNQLRIAGEVKEETRGNALRQRRGKFAYRTTLPADTDPENADARLNDGILTLRLPKVPRSRSRSRRIEVSG